MQRPTRPSSFTLTLLLWLAWLTCAPAAWAADTAAATPPTAQEVSADLQKSSARVDKIRKSLDNDNSADALKSYSDNLLSAKRDADAAVTALEPQLTQLKDRIGQLGAVDPNAPENTDITQQRQDLAQQQADLDSAIKKGKLLSVDAEQLSVSIDKIRTQQFNARIAERFDSPLSPTMWRQWADNLPDDKKRLSALWALQTAQWKESIQDTGDRSWMWWLALSLAMSLPLRIGLRWLAQKFFASDRAPDSRLRRSGLAISHLLIGTILPSVACAVLVYGLTSADAIAARFDPVASAFIKAMLIAAFLLSLSLSLLSPHKPSWRILQMDDIAAHQLHRCAWVAAPIIWLAVMLKTISAAAHLSAVNAMAVDGLVAILLAALIVAILRILKQLRIRQALAAPGSPGKVQRHGWQLLAWMGGHVAVSIALGAALLGYLHFSLFATSQMVWITLVFLGVTLLMQFADDFSLWIFSPQSRTGTVLVQGLGISESLLKQTGVLISAIVRVALILVGIGAVLAPFGDYNAVTNWLNSASSGVQIGEVVVKPIAVVRALVVLVIVLVGVRMVREWLENTYLPSTQLDIGARNSINTVVRYVGIVLAVLWALTALGVGFERLALLASALSVGIGFGLQAITQNFVSGLILLAERPVKLGDRVRISDQEGDIRRISVRATEIQLDDKSSLIVPNSELITKSVFNLTVGGAPGRIQIKFAVPISTDVVKLRDMLLSIYQSHDSVLATPAPSMFVDSLNGSLININSYAYVSSPRRTYSVRSDLLFEVLRQLPQAGIPLATPTDIHVITDPPSMSPTVPASTPAPGERS